MDKFKGTIEFKIYPKHKPPYPGDYIVILSDKTSYLCFYDGQAFGDPDVIGYAPIVADVHLSDSVVRKLEYELEGVER